MEQKIRDFNDKQVRKTLYGKLEKLDALKDEMPDNRQPLIDR